MYKLTIKVHWFSCKIGFLGSLLMSQSVPSRQTRSLGVGSIIKIINFCKIVLQSSAQRCPVVCISATNHHLLRSFRGFLAHLFFYHTLMYILQTKYTLYHNLRYRIWKYDVGCSPLPVKGCCQEDEFKCGDIAYWRYDKGTYGRRGNEAQMVRLGHFRRRMRMCLVFFEIGLGG